MPSLAAVATSSFARSAAVRLLSTTSHFTSRPLPLLFFFNYHLRFLNTKCPSKLDPTSFGPPALGEPNISLLKGTDPIIQKSNLMRHCLCTLCKLLNCLDNWCRGAAL